MSELTLVLGGARSGKSAYAERLASARGPRVLYVATAEVRDSEMAERIRHHRERRPATWQTLEEPLELVSALALESEWDAVLLECLSLWISNLLLARIPASGEVSLNTADCIEAEILLAVRGLLDWQQAAGARLIVVSTEAGLGVVPPYPLGRLYRDLLGRANQLVAADAQQVYYLVAGLGLELKALGASAVPPLP